MMKPPAGFAGLEDLLDLGHGEGIDMRPTLLRVLTDLYLQRPTHTPEDERYYTELALRLIDATDVATRASLAARLATCGSAPPPVIERLARDVIEVARPVLEHSTCLAPDELDAIAKECGGAHADIIRARPPAASHGARSAGVPEQASAESEACELSELFYAAGTPERRLILLNLDYSALPPLQPPSSMQRTDIWRLESAVLQHNTEAVVRELERSLGISRTQARRIINDELGEPILVAAKAMNLPADVLQRMLLFMNPRVGESVDRVYELAELYSEISVDAARRLLGIWLDAERAEARPVRHESVAWRTAAENARRALSEVSRRPELQHDARLRGHR
jgi:uncharacterized protein (DUF2336 family)